MILTLHESSGSPRAVVIFLGWAMDSGVLAGVHHPDYDIWAVSDYRSGRCDFSPLEAYREVVVIAWSWGVPSAARFLRSTRLPVTLAMAVNGTLTPVSRHSGIAPEVYRATLESLTPASLLKFYRRCCGSRECYSTFMEHAPSRPFETLADELRAIEAAPAELADAALFDIALVASEDLVIPQAAASWAGHPRLLQSPTPAHLPDFGRIIATYVRGKGAVAGRFAGAAETYDSAASPQQAVARRAWEIVRPFALAMHHPRLVEAGPGTGALTALWRRELQPASERLMDLAPAMAGVECADAETEVMEMAPGSVDLLLSASTIQWFNSPARFIRRLERVLAPGGVAMLATYGAGHFSEIAAMLPASLAYLTPGTVRGAAGSLRCEVTGERRVMSFESPRGLLRHLAESGVNSLGSTAEASSAAARAIVRSGVRTLTYEPLYILLQKAR